MTHVLITAGRRDRGVAAALAQRLGLTTTSAEVVSPEDLLKEVKDFAKNGSKSAVQTPRLTRARAVMVVWSKPTVKSRALQEVARYAVVDGARLTPVIVNPVPAELPYPNVVPISLADWNGRDDAHPGLITIAERVGQSLATLAPTVAAAKTPKRIVLFCDGTWQSLGADKRTNVAQAAMAVDRMDAKGVHQVTYYDDGVGATDQGLTRFLVGATGRGLDNRILSAYRFLTLNYEHGDEIYLFGFSRGAYTVRSLTGLIRTCGILRREFAYREREAMSLYRRRITIDENGQPVEVKDRDFKEAVEFRETYSRAWPASAPTTNPNDPRAGLTVRYVGVWDTVGSLGVPEIWYSRRKHAFHDLRLGHWVQSARHAVALDEKRKAFEAALWSNVGQGAEEGRHPHAQQVWFAGDHGGVGGGDAREGLSNIPLLWLIEGAAAQGLSFKSTILERFRLAMDPIIPEVRRFNLSGLPTYLRGAQWRIGPSDLSEVHPSALKRWAASAKYRPEPLKRLKIADVAAKAKP
jgi:uncharacterized protein (DUF2235 family)